MIDTQSFLDNISVKEFWKSFSTALHSTKLQMYYFFPKHGVGLEAASVQVNSLKSDNSTFRTASVSSAVPAHTRSRCNK